MSTPLSQSRPSCGFTLIELMLTLVLIAAMLTLSAPSFISFQRSSELTSQANSLVAALNTARTEAMKRNTDVYIVPGGTANQWSDGWTVFVDSDRSGAAFDAAKDSIVLTHSKVPSYFSTTGTGTANENPAYVMYNGSGYPKTTGGAFGAVTINFARNDLTGTELLQQTRRIKIAKTGRVRACKPLSATDVTCSASTED
ncbi:MAG: GspH/FimT family pseudopilin [Acidovorax sp.]|uniref:GspH/FimT family pseudopilin n=1 Tax=Acidovorax sp. TaxID=1872122 RepID=UPI0039E2B0CB